MAPFIKFGTFAAQITNTLIKGTPLTIDIYSPD
ncbi:MAG: hypothetical protein KQ78_01873 [Candidatus Izimaplasma bacterium HR2]|nr:MAG: hypothetical protein KQ78_01873 [Candidatus Izimaplasma bacterium HR2]